MAGGVKHVVLVGATDGIGLALARSYLRAGWRVGLVGRSPERVATALSEIPVPAPGTPVADVPAADVPAADDTGSFGGEITTAVLDLTDRAAIVPALEDLLVRMGQMDLLIYTAGVMSHGPDDLPEMITVNVTSAMDVLEWAAAYFQDAGRGHVAAIGSVAGDRGRKGHAQYGAGKAALHTYLEGLRHRLHVHGVRVSTIKPGWVRTKMLGGVPAFPPTIQPDDAAERIRRALGRGSEEVYVPGWWRWIMLSLRLMPRALFKRIAPP